MSGITLASCIILNLVSKGQGYTRTNGNLTAIPGDILANEVEINLSGNNIAAVDTFPYFSALGQILLSTNLLVSFPNVCSSGATLRTLKVARNAISVIDPDRLDCLVAIWTLNLEGNELLSIPDVSGPGSTLQGLYLARNNFNHIPSIPHLCPTLKNLMMSRNSFPEAVTVNDLRQFPSLKSLTLTLIYLHRFPDISVLENSLMKIDFHGHRITEMPTEILNVMTKLESIKMYDFKLKHFPDFSNSPSRHTINYIDLSGNEITNIPHALITCLSVVDKLLLDNNPMTSFPNVCHMTTSAPVISWRLPSGYMRCDRHVRWLKRMEEANNLVLLDTFEPCSEPAELVGLNWNDLHMDNFTYEEWPFVSSLPVRLDATYKCQVRDVMKWRPVISILQCAALCLREVGCEYFRYGDPVLTGNQDNCGLSDVEAPVVNLITDPRSETWYALD